MRMMMMALILLVLVGCVDRTRTYKVTDSSGKQYKGLFHVITDDGSSTFVDRGGKSYVFSGNYTVLED